MRNPSESDCLLRITDREDRPATWSELRRLAEADPTVFERLADLLEDDMLVRTAVNRAGGGSASAEVELRFPAANATERSSRWPAVSGWLAAAAMLVVWLISGPPAPSNRSGHPDTRATVGDHSDRVVIANTVEPRPELIRELPDLFVRSEPAETGNAIDVFYVRQTLERRRLQDLTTLRIDDAGAGWRAQVQPAQFSSPETF